MIGIFFLSISAMVVALEIMRTPSMFEKVSPPLETPQIIPNANTPKSSDVSQASTTLPVMQDQILPGQYFNVAALQKQNIILKGGMSSNAIFRHAQLNKDIDPFQLATFLFEANGKTIGAVSRVLPTEEMSTGRLLSLVRKKLYTSIASEDSGIITLSDSLNTRGEANFYLNDKKNFSNMVFLVTRSNSKVLALQFPEEYNTLVAQILPLFFE